MLACATTSVWACPSVGVTANPTAIYPQGCDGSPTSTSITVTVKRPNGTPWSGLNVSMAASTSGGGHSHTSGPARPVGTFDPSWGVTNAQGQFTSTYTSTIVAGSDYMSASVLVGSIRYYGGCTVTVRVPNLAAMSAGSYYDLVGATTDHPSNHYATSNTRTQLASVATDYYNLYPGDPDLAHNDMSLVRGGVFDLGPNYDGTYWQPPHHEHRVGRNCDLSNSDNLPSSHLPDLEDIINDHGGTKLNEGNHWHLTFDS